jgi:peptide/nickel transport system permease protein
VAWFPTGGFESADPEWRTTLQRGGDVAWHLVLPVATYTAASLAALSRYARVGIVDVIRADYVRTARAKGLHEAVVIVKHAARNGMMPILTLLGTLLPTLFGGSVVIEVVFNIPGMGRYLFESIGYRDYNAVMAVLLSASGLALLGVLVSDLSYALVDPRVSFDEAQA